MLKVNRPIHRAERASVFDSSLEPVMGFNCDVQCESYRNLPVKKKIGAARWPSGIVEPSENENPTTPAQITSRACLPEPSGSQVTGAIYGGRRPRRRRGDKTLLNDFPSTTHPR